jgi:hypothetical protein
MLSKSFDSGTFYCNAITDWNRLPDKLKKITAKNTFKHEIKKHLFNSARVKILIFNYGYTLY